MNGVLMFSYVRVLKRLAIAVTLIAGIYTLYFLGTSYHRRESSPVLSLPEKDSVLKPLPQFDSGSEDALSSVIQSRDIFSSSGEAVTLNTTPSGQLPSNLKVVGIIISNPSEVIIEDTAAQHTYFISESNAQAGIHIARIDKDQVTVTYQGQNISIPLEHVSRASTIEHLSQKVSPNVSIP
jgi:type II secretory pathway component PulC